MNEKCKKCEELTKKFLIINPGKEGHVICEWCHEHIYQAYKKYSQSM